nr:hypothetical protein [Tanacetum cinerariifolium]
MTENYMPLKFDFGIKESKFTYGPKQSTTSESNAKTNDLDSCDSNSSVETLEFVPKPVASKPKVCSDAPIIEEYESNIDDEHVSIPSKEQKKPSFAFVNTVEHVKTPRQTVKEQITCSQNPKPNKRDWNGLMSKIMGLRYGFTKKACLTLKGKDIFNSGCPRHTTGNKAYLVNYQDFNGGHVAFGGSKGQITRKDTKCLVLSPDFKLPNENQVLLRVHRQHNMYSFNLENIVPSGGGLVLLSFVTSNTGMVILKNLG